MLGRVVQKLQFALQECLQALPLGQIGTSQTCSTSQLGQCPGDQRDQRWEKQRHEKLAPGLPFRAICCGRGQCRDQDLHGHAYAVAQKSCLLAPLLSNGSRSYLTAFLPMESFQQWALSILKALQANCGCSITCLSGAVLPLNFPFWDITGSCCRSAMSRAADAQPVRHRRLQWRRSADPASRGLTRSERQVWVDCGHCFVA